MGFPVRQLAADEGVLFADRFATLPAVGNRQAFLQLLADLEPGLTELTLRPAIDTPELRAIATDWRARVADHVLLWPTGAWTRPSPRPESPSSATDRSARPCAAAEGRGPVGAPGLPMSPSTWETTDILRAIDGSGRGRG